MERYCYRCERDVELRKAPDTNAQLCSVCGTVIVHSADYLPPGTMIGGFRILNELGRGGMGIVYRARQLNLERDVALKVLADNLANDHEFVTRFFKEARAAASLNHPNIVQVFDAGRSPEGISFFAMELIEGDTLESHIDSHGMLSPGEALRIAVKIADALDYAWKTQKLTHGDIKPDNIILSRSGGAKLADLGLAKCIYDDASEDGIMATPLYAPPEVIKGEVDLINYHADMYSFGATLYQMLAGVPPFPDGEPEAVFSCHLNDTPPSLYTYNNKIAPALVEICEQMLEKEPDRRPDTWGDVHAVLSAVRDPEVSGKVFHTYHSSGVDFTRRSPLVSAVKYLVVLVILLSLAAVALFFMKPKKEEQTKVPVMITDPELVIKKWDALKSKISNLDPDLAIKKVEGFIQDYNANVPTDVFVVKKSLECKLSAIEKNRQRKADEQAKFEKMVTEAVVSIKRNGLDDPKTDIKVIENFYAKLHALLRQASDISYLKFPEGAKDILTDACKKLSERIMEHKKLMEKIRNEEIAETQLERLHHDQERLSQAREEFKTQLALNSTIDNYYTALNNFQKVKKLAVLKDGLEKWDQGAEVLAPRYAERVDFLVQTVLPDVSRIFHLIKSKESCFVNKKLPKGVCSDKIKYYIVKSFSDKGIKLVYNNNSKVTLGYTILWSSLTHKQLAILAKERLLTSGNALMEEDKNIILSFLLLFDNESFLDVLQHMNGLSNRAVALWQAVDKDFSVSEKEVECIELYHSLVDDVATEEYADAAMLFQRLQNVSAGTFFASRYDKVLPQLKMDLSRYTPLLSALMQMKELFALSGDPGEKFNMAMVILARYNHSLSELPEKYLSRLHRVRVRALSSLIHASGVDSIADNRLPFYSWSKEEQGAVQAFFDLLIKSGKLDELPDVERFMKLAVALDNGGWRTVKSIYASMGDSDFANLEYPDFMKSWISSFIFAYGLADLQFGDGSARLAIHKLMEKQCSNCSTGKMFPKTLSLLMEYDLLIRNTKYPLFAANRYHYRALAAHHASFRVGLLGVLACIENRQSKVAQFHFLSTRLRNIYRGKGEVDGDFAFLNAAERLFSLKPLLRSDIEKLISVDCFYPDTSARVLVAALARYHVLNGISFSDENLLIDSLEKRLSSLVVSGDLWRKIQLLKMANNSSAGDVFSLAEVALKKKQICTTRFYSGLLMIRAGAEYLLEGWSRDEVKRHLLCYLAASEVVSEGDLQDLNVVTDDEHPSSIIARLFKEHQPEKAFQYGILGIMVHCKNALVKSEIEKVMNLNSNSLCWEEQYLIKQIRNWR